MELTATQWIVNVLIWSLTAAGAFFGIRARIRRRRAPVERRSKE